MKSKKEREDVGAFDIDAFIEEERRKLWDQIQWEHTNARCFVCGRSRADIEAGRDGYYGDVMRTRDDQRYVCSDHKDQDESREIYDVTEHIKMSIWAAKFHGWGEKQCTEEGWYKYTASYFGSHPERYHLVNLPEGYVKYLRKSGQIWQLTADVQQTSLW